MQPVSVRRCAGAAVRCRWPGRAGAATWPVAPPRRAARFRLPASRPRAGAVGLSRGSSDGRTVRRQNEALAAGWLRLCLYITCVCMCTDVLCINVCIYVPLHMLICPRFTNSPQCTPLSVIWSVCLIQVCPVCDWHALCSMGSPFGLHSVLSSDLSLVRFCPFSQVCPFCQACLRFAFCPFCHVCPSGSLSVRSVKSVSPVRFLSFQSDLSPVRFLSVLSCLSLWFAFCPFCKSFFPVRFLSILSGLPLVRFLSVLSGLSPVRFLSVL